MHTFSCVPCNSAGQHASIFLQQVGHVYRIVYIALAPRLGTHRASSAIFGLQLFFTWLAAALKRVIGAEHNQIAERSWGLVFG